MAAYIGRMKRFVLITAFAAVLSPQAAVADEDGFSLMEEGISLFMRGLAEEMEPALEELQNLAEEVEPALDELLEQMGPAFTVLMTRIDDLQHYEAPEILENGDILIRRSPDAPPFERAEEITEEEAEEIDL